VSVLELQRVVRSYEHRAEGHQVEVLRAPGLKVGRGEIVAVLGANGSGKSTLLETLAFLQRPCEGRVLLDGADPWAEERSLQARRRCPALLQKTVLFSTSVLDNVMAGPRWAGVARPAARDRARRALEAVDLASLERRSHTELSGGEARRVALARVLALESEVLVLDEPTAGLDAESSHRVAGLIRQLNRDRGTTVIMASHSLERAVSLAHRVVTLVDGLLVNANLDNRSVGTMTRVASGWEYRDHLGWRHVFEGTELVRDAWSRLGPREGRVQVAVPAAKVLLRQARGDGPASLRGALDTIRHERGHARVRVRLPPRRQKVRAHIELAVLEQLDLSLGSQVELAFQPSSVFVLPLERPTPPAPGTAS
jgi:energy-coupling factor transporter ATP-binding protein EcfA2